MKKVRALAAIFKLIETRLSMSDQLSTRSTRVGFVSGRFRRAPHTFRHRNVD